MKIFKKVLLVLLLLVLAILVSAYFYSLHLKPTYKGSVSLNAIENKTEVYFDDYGIPHIYALTQQDAMVALGYVHAQDRLWQMELLRRIAPGKLSEIFGKDLLQTDTFFVSLGIDDYSKSIVKNIDTTSQTYLLASAYLNGINQFIDKGPTPIEFSLIGVEKTHFQLTDIHNILGYMAFSFAMAHKTDPLLSEIKNKLGDAYLEELNIDVNPNTTLIKNFKTNLQTAENYSLTVSSLISKTSAPLFEGSNSWVIGGKKTASGKVLFANDPHIGFSQPAVWYEAHVNTPNYEMYGYFMAGVPFPLLGHNHNYAYGLTMFENDDVDFFKEETNPKNPLQYKTVTGYKPYTVIQKTIKIKNEEDVIVEVKSTEHGPIMNQALENISQKNPIAMYWVFTQIKNDGLDALYLLSHAKNMNDAKKAASKIHAPGLNIMYGDAQNNIAWWATGKLYKYTKNVNRKFVLNGSSGENEISEFLDFSENPMAENPDWNYVYSANNQPDSIINTLYPGYYLPEDRAKRIVSYLHPKNNWELNDMKPMITDVTSLNSTEICKEVVRIVSNSSLTEKENEFLTILKNWDGSSERKSIAPTIYNKWVYLYLKYTFEDELGEKLFTQLNSTHLMKRIIQDHLSRENSVWWDNIQTKNKKETREEILTLAFTNTISELETQLGSDISQWNWGKVHTLEHQHPLGKVAVFKPFFNVGPFEVNGAREVLNNRGFEYTNNGVYTITSGPSTRRLIDFSNIENSVSILPTGNSGNVFSKHYKDQADLFNEGKFRKMKLNKQEIINSSTKLTITPKNE